MTTPDDDLNVTISADISNLRRELEMATRLGRSFGSSMSRAFTDAAIKGRKLGDVLRSLATSLASSALRAGMRPLTNMLGRAFGSLFSGSSIMPFAKGGVINSPVLFPQGKGRTGLMGEAGAEAVMPLARGPDGKLGVRTNDGGKSVNINFHVEASDAESFARSESQITAMIARAAQRGARNL